MSVLAPYAFPILGALVLFLIVDACYLVRVIFTETESESE